MPDTCTEVVIFDTEYWTDEGVWERNWHGLYDPPPYLVQIGAFKVRLETGLPVADEYISYIIPRNRDGSALDITPFFTEFTKITPDDIATKGVEAADAILDFASFCDGAPLYSYGYDIESTFLPTCYAAGMACPFRVEQGRNVAKVLHRAGMSEADIYKNSSGTLAAHFGIELDAHHVHDARCDAWSILVALRHLEKTGVLDINMLAQSFDVLEAPLAA